MANTLDVLVTNLRALLLDTTPTYLWPDTALQQAMTEAVAEHSYLFPRLGYTLYDLTNGQQEVTLGPVGPSGTFQNPPPVATVDVISVVGAECPTGTAIPEDPWLTSDPPGTSASRSTQGWRARWGVLRLRSAATGAMVGTGTVAVFVLQTWILPDNSTAWNGPTSDVPLLNLLGKRNAYQMLAEWQARQQGTSTPTITSGNINVHIDVAPILAALETQIARAISLRAARSGGLTPIPAGR